MFSGYIIQITESSARSFQVSLLNQLNWHSYKDVLVISKD